MSADDQIRDLHDRLANQYTTAGFVRERPPPQKVLNESWPPADVAKRLRDVEAARQIPCLARVHWAVDGWEEIPGKAVRWTGTHVCVMSGDERLQVPYVWLAAADIQRAQESAPPGP